MRPRTLLATRLYDGASTYGLVLAVSGVGSLAGKRGGREGAAVQISM